MLHSVLGGAPSPAELEEANENKGRGSQEENASQQGMGEQRWGENPWRQLDQLPRHAHSHSFSPC